MSAESELGIDAPLDGRALVILEVHGPRQADEFRIEGLRALLVANVVFDDPQALVDRLKAPMSAPMSTFA